MGGGWTLLVGWLLPAAVNVLLLAYVVLPASEAEVLLTSLDRAGVNRDLAAAGAAVLLGVLLASVQTPLYRVLEGYIGWRPQAASRRALPRWVPSLSLTRWQERQVSRRNQLLGRLDLLELTDLEAGGALDTDDVARLRELRADDTLVRFFAGDSRRTAAQRNLLDEKLQRYPVDEQQIVPTRLGNAIRRFEEYGYDRFRLDSQRMWNDLTAVAPERAAKQVEQARTTVDLLICLLYGHLIVGAVALGTVPVADTDHEWLLAAVGAGLILLARVWYEVAIRSTDDWAAAVRSLVNLGRKPLAEALALDLPETIEQERQMWGLVATLTARPYHRDRRAALDQFRTRPGTDDAQLP
ncbi:hypothetical protein ACFO1B_16705 [Dactylosporangium siamense]|uniref:Uncharacterized protein n=1 Tax=Dactylosporangium siamense TaxID=685454 RepID=A0A919PL01_9ACTN|nr:hypothetical protein [Dactylosporangium siamense]GIG45482.1 hypothetical protein Dsi01nite_035230 [Dactylosporangium siamense]